MWLLLLACKADPPPPPDPFVEVVARVERGQMVSEELYDDPPDYLQTWEYTLREEAPRPGATRTLRAFVPGPIQGTPGTLLCWRMERSLLDAPLVREHEVELHPCQAKP